MEGVTHQTTHQKDKQPLDAFASRGRLPHWDVVPKTGVEPVWMLSPTVFKTAASAIPPLRRRNTLLS